MTKADWLRSEIKKWFEINYLDGDEVQDGQMLASSECLDALIEYHMNFLRSEVEKLDGNKRKSIAVMSPDEIVSDALKFKRHPNQAFNDGHATGYNQALTTIITRYKEELLELDSKEV